MLIIAEFIRLTYRPPTVTTLTQIPDLEFWVMSQSGCHRWLRKYNTREMRVHLPLGTTSTYIWLQARKVIIMEGRPHML